MGRWSPILLLAVLSLGLGKTGSPRRLSGEHDWLQFSSPVLEGRGNQRDSISAANVARLAVVWRVALPAVSDGSPVYVANVITSHSFVDLVIVGTTDGRVIAVDAQRGTIVWQTAAPRGPRWTTSSPAVDPQKRFVFGYGLDGYVHKYAIETGKEIIGGGWPELITLKGDVEKGSSNIAISTAGDGSTYLYMPTSAYPDPGDAGDYQGHLVTINIDTGTQQVFNALCSDKRIHFQNTQDQNDCADLQAGIWARNGVTYDPETDRVFVTTGNGGFNANNGGFNWGSSVVALRPDGTTDGGTPIDSYTPADYQRLTDEDADLSSSGVVPLPTSRAEDWPRLGVQGGKDRRLRLLNLENLSGTGGPRSIGGELQIVPVPQTGEVLSQPAAWLDRRMQRTWLFVANRHGISAFRLEKNADDSPQLVRRWMSTTDSGTTPIVANGVLYLVAPHRIVAMRPTTGNVLWRDTSIGDIHWQSPIIVNGTLYVADLGGYLNAYTVDGQ
ncbi:MAG TPA: PQQ-binding-like beta-propeller repeat protein [Thermoanaerobaculia bacterium]